jgi:hypothetical protein
MYLSNLLGTIKALWVIRQDQEATDTHQRRLIDPALRQVAQQRQCRQEHTKHHPCTPLCRLIRVVRAQVARRISIRRQVRRRTSIRRRWDIQAHRCHHHLNNQEEGRHITPRLVTNL